jgi:signal transduction histidine kinase/ligand-binding sensor domain-containing protein
MAKHWLILLTILATMVSGFSQDAFVVRRFGREDGLVANLCTFVNAGPRGRILVKHAGSESISWLDGYSIKKIPAPPKPGGPAYESPSSQVWSVWPGGLQEYDGRDWRSYSIPEIQKEIDTNSPLVQEIRVLPTKQGRVLFLLSDGLYEFSNENSTSPRVQIILRAEQAMVGQFTGMTTADDGGLWLSARKGVVKLSGPVRNIGPHSQWQKHPIRGSELDIVDHLEEPTADEEGGLLLLGPMKQNQLKAVVHFNGGHWSIMPVKADDYIKSWRGTGNTYWMATRDCLLSFDENAGSFRQSQKLPLKDISSVAPEPYGVFWVASSGGLFRYSQPAWSTPTVFGGIKSPFETTAEDSQSGFWLTSSNCLYNFHENSLQVFALPSKAGAHSETSNRIFARNDRSIIVQTKSTLIQYRPKTRDFSILPVSEGKPLKPLGFLQDGILCLQLPSAANGKAGRLVTFDGENLGNFPLPQPELDSERPVDQLYASANGDLWLIGERYIARYHRQDWQVFPAVEGVIPEGARCLTEVSDNRIWFGGTDRIWEFDGKSWSLIRSGFREINALTRSREGIVWVATSYGLHRFYQGVWGVNGTAEGLPSENIKNVFEDNRGRVWVSTERGLTVYHPDADSEPPRTSISPFKDGKTSLLEGALVAINYDGRDKWNYTPPEKLLYSYRLDERDWSGFSPEKTTTFPDLTAGKHYFQVRSMDRNWNVDPKPSILEFSITIPWYQQTPLMLIITFATGATLLFGALALNRHLQLLRSYAEVEKKVADRTRELELANQELLHSQKMNALGTLAAGIAHDFNNILSIIKGSAQIIEENVDNQEKIRVRTSRIKTVVEQGSGIVKAMLGFSRGSELQDPTSDVNSVVDETVRLLGDRFLREVSVKSEKTDSLPPVSISKDFIQQILLNFIFNAAEAMPDEKHIVLSTELINQLPTGLALSPKTAPQYVCISVEDKGVGIAPEVMPRIFEPFFTTKAFSARRGTGLGLSMVYELSRKIDAGLKVTSTVGKGSKFTLLLPVEEKQGKNL